LPGTRRVPAQHHAQCDGEAGRIGAGRSLCELVRDMAPVQIVAPLFRHMADQLAHVAQSGYDAGRRPCLFLVAKRTSIIGLAAVAFDPWRTFKALPDLLVGEGSLSRSARGRCDVRDWVARLLLGVRSCRNDSGDRRLLARYRCRQRQAVWVIGPEHEYHRKQQSCQYSAEPSTVE
jgi:hypothetical protein